MKKKVILWAVLFCTLLLIACGSDKSRDTNDTVEVVESEVVEGKDILSGTWYIGAIYYNNNLIDIQDVDALADLYDSVFLTFNDDGTFIYTDRYNYKGEYSKYEQSDYESYLLKTTSLSTYDLENGQIVEKEVEAEPTSLRTFIITVLDEGNTFEFSEYDPASGKAKVDEEPFVFVKDNSSDYIEDNKAEINNETQENEKSKNSTDKNENNQSSYIKPSTPDYSGNVSSGMRNALNRAKEYLDYTAFSYSGLIDQLEFEGFTKEEATYGADNCGADWNEQAVKKAEEYLDYTSFSYSGLIDQLEFEGFTRSQAEYGASIAY